MVGKRNTAENILHTWLCMTQDDVNARFAGLTGPVVRGTGDERFVYIPGTRKDRVMLVAHADTVWDAWDWRCNPVCKGGVFRSAVPGRGIGADDRAGCAILWELRELGHSLLITSGEEHGQVASTFIVCHSSNHDIAEKIHKEHQFVVQFDRRNAKEFKCYDVGTEEFREYCSTMTGYTEPDRSSTTDIRVLCRHVCGVNLSTGFHNEHLSNETLVVKEWEHTLDVAMQWLSNPSLPKFIRSGV